MLKKIKERTLETEAELLRDCYGMGMILLAIWFLGWIFGRDWIHKIHSRFFQLPSPQFDLIHYSGMMFFKMLVLTLFFIPWLAIKASLCCKE